MKRGIVLAALLLFGAGAAHAQAPSEDWGRIVAAAKKEGRVVLYSGASPTVTQRLVSGFKKACMAGESAS